MLISLFLPGQSSGKHSLGNAGVAGEKYNNICATMAAGQASRVSCYGPSMI